MIPGILDPLPAPAGETVTTSAATGGSAAAAEVVAPPTGFQDRVDAWMLVCFGERIAADGTERNHRFLEESLELVQSTGCTASEAHQLVQYVFGRPVGERSQEVGGVMVTLAALCTAFDLNMGPCGEVELDRVWTKVEAIRAKQAAKPKHSPLPAAPTPSRHAETTLPRWAVRLLRDIVESARPVVHDGESVALVDDLDEGDKARLLVVLDAALRGGR